MAYELGPDGFIGRSGRRAGFTSPPAPPAPRRGGNGGRRGISAGLIIALVSIAIVILVILANSSQRSVTPNNIAPAPTPVVNTTWPTDSPNMSPSGFIQAIDARVESFRFFEAGDTAPPRSDRVYASSFLPEQGRFIYWELNLVHPTRTNRQTFATTVYLYNPDGSLKSQLQSASYVEPDWMNSVHSDRFIEPVAGWGPGNYRVSFFVEGIKVAEGAFVIESREAPQQVAVGQPLTEEPQSPEKVPAPEPSEVSRSKTVDSQQELAANCETERRLQGARYLGRLELEQLGRVRGSCQRLYGTDPVNGTGSRPAPAVTQPAPGWHRFGENQRTPALQTPSKTVEEAQLIRKVQPSYPQLAKQARVQGKVEISAMIGTDGRLRNIKVISGHPLLTSAAIAAVEQWRYRPTMLGGIPVETETNIDVNFTLGQ